MKPSHDSMRGDLRTLERIAVNLELYASRKQLISHRGPGLIGSADLLDDRCNRAIAAIVWVQGEMASLTPALDPLRPP